MRNALVAFGLGCVALWLAIWAWARTPSYAPLGELERAAVMARVRAALDRTPPPDGAVPARALPGPLFVALYVDGAPALELESRAPTLPAALDDVVAQLRRAAPSDDGKHRGRLKVDVTVARAPLVTRPAPLFALSLVPGVDGIGVTVGDRTAYLLPDELMRADALASQQPLAAMEFELGANLDQIGGLVAKKLGLDGDAFARAPKRWFRFRTDGFVEPADAARRGQALPVVRGNVPGPRLSKAALRDAAVAGGKYLLRHLYDDGRFGYEYIPATDQDQAYVIDYSLPRHAGATYFLAQLYGATRDARFRDGAARALGFMEQRQPRGCGRPDRGCVANADQGRADLGSAAMALLAVGEFERATGDRGYMKWARRLANFVVFMQKPDGDFCHLYDVGSDQRDEKTKLLYYSGEGAFALAKLLALVGPGDADHARWAATLDRALDYLTGAQYANLAGQFYFGEDHWTCMAADAGWDALPAAHRERYARFCDRFAAFLRRTQFTPRDAVVRGQPDFLGAYGFSPFLPPHATPVGSRSETTISTYVMQRRRGLVDSAEGRATREQIELGMQFLLDHQIRDDAAYLMANPDAARGGFLMSDVKRYIRIDFVQHSCSAMLRALDVL